MASIGPRPSPSCLLQRGGEGGNRAINQADGCSQNPWRRWLHRGSESKSGRPRGCCLGSCSSKANGMGRCMKCRVPGVAKLFSRFGRCCRESGSCWSASRSSRPTPLCPCRQAVLFPCAHSLWEGKKHGAPPHPPHCSNVCVSALHLPFQAGWVLLGQLCFWQSASGNLLPPPVCGLLCVSASAENNKHPHVRSAPRSDVPIPGNVTVMAPSSVICRSHR